MCGKVHQERGEYSYPQSPHTCESMENRARYRCIHTNSHDTENIADILTRQILWRKRNTNYCTYRGPLWVSVSNISITSKLDEQQKAEVWALILEFAEYHLKERKQVQAEGGFRNESKLAFRRYIIHLDWARTGGDMGEPLICLPPRMFAQYLYGKLPQ